MLAGGRSRRFGGDKLAARIGGRAVLDHTIDAVAALGPVLVVGRSQAPAGSGRHTTVADAVPAAADLPDGAVDGAIDGRWGPLAGIVAALEAATTPLVAVVAGDMPGADAQLLSQLAAGWHDEVAVVPVGASGPQPLHAVWATRHASGVRAAFDAGERSPLALVRRLDGRFVRVGDRDGWSRDVDTPGDLAAVAQRLVPGAGRDGPPSKPQADQRLNRGPSRR